MRPRAIDPLSERVNELLRRAMIQEQYVSEWADHPRGAGPARVRAAPRLWKGASRAPL